MMASNAFLKRKLGVKANQLDETKRQIVKYFIEAKANDYSKNDLLNLWKSDSLNYYFEYENVRGCRRPDNTFPTYTMLQVTISTDRLSTYFRFKANIELIKEALNN